MTVAVATCREQVFAGGPSSVRDVRAFLAACLNGSGYPLVDDVVLAADELAVNAVRHSRSCLPGGHFVVKVEVQPGAWVRLEVVDQGSATTLPPPGPPLTWEAEAGRGLGIVRALAAASGEGGDGEGHCVWCRFDWPGGSALT